MFPQPGPSIEGTLGFIQASREGLERNENLQLVVLKKGTLEFLGCVGLHRTDTETPEVGIWLKKSAHGQRLGVEAVTGLVAWARDHLVYRHFTYPVDRRNRGSRRIAEENRGVVRREYKQPNLAGRELDQVEYWIP